MENIRTAARVEEWNSQQVHPKVRLCNGQKNVSKGWQEKGTWQHNLDLQSCIWMNHKTSGIMSFRQIGPKKGCLIRHSRPSMTAHTPPHTFSQAQKQKGQNLGLFLDLSANNFSVYQSQLNMRPSVWQLKLGPNWVTTITSTTANPQQNGWERKE